MNRLLGYLCLLLLATGAAAAQSKLEPPELERYRRWGALRVRPGLELSRIGYDTNILRASDAVPSAQIGDYTATLSPKIELLSLFGRSAFLTFQQRFDYTLYVNYPEQNYLNNHSSARVTIPFKRRYGFFVDGLYGITHERPPDLESARPKQDRVRLAYGFLFEPGWRTEIEVALSADDYTYSDSDVGPNVTAFIAERLNRLERGTSLDIRYKAFGRTRIVLKGLVSNIDFEYPFTLDVGTGEPLIEIPRDTDEWTALGGLEFGRGGPLTGTVLLGWNKVVPQDDRISELSIPVGDAQLVYRLNSRTRFEIDGERRSGFAVYGANSYFVTTEVGLRTVYYFSRPIGLEAGVGTGRLTFPATLNLLGREDRLSRYELGVRLRNLENSQGKQVEYSVRIRQIQRRSTIPELDRTDTLLGFGAVFGY
jgi:hypothetical protein